MVLKKMACFLTMAFMVMPLTACGGQDSSTSGGSAGTSQGVEEGNGAAQEGEADRSTGKTDIKQANADPANTQITDETLVIGLPSEPADLWGSATNGTETWSMVINGALLDTLVAKDKATGEILPNLATEWEWVDDTHLKFTLRDDVKMSDGTPLVADDVVFSASTWVKYSAASDTGKYFDPKKPAVAKDEHTVVLGFNIKAPDLLELMSWTNFGIVSEDEVKALGGIEAAARKPAFGSGKYRFKEWKNGQSITLERNEDYWNPDYKGYFKTLQFTFTNDAAARVMAVQSGDAGVACELPLSMASTYAENDQLVVVMETLDSVQHLFYNMAEGHATSDSKVREAIDAALDFDAIAMVGSVGYAQQSLGYFIPTSKYYNETYTKEERKLDVERAKSLLEEAGQSGLTITCVGTQDTEALYTVIQENLRAAGITLQINTVDVPQFVQEANKGNYDIIVVDEYVPARVPSFMDNLHKNTVEGFHIGGPQVVLPEIDAAIMDIIQEKDEEKAKEQIAAVEQLIKEETILTNLYPNIKAGITGKDIRGYTTRERGFIDVTNFYKE